MKEIGMLFSTDMVRAIDDNIKKCTRRIIKVPSDYTWGGQVEDSTDISENGKCCFLPPNVKLPDVTGAVYVNPPCASGDRIYVRETWRVSDKGICMYKADCSYKGVYPVKWHPSIHMPEKYARTWLEVTGVRVERTGGITQEEALKEGFSGRGSFLEYMLKKYGDTDKDESELLNCWCWVIDFKVVEK